MESDFRKDLGHTTWDRVYARQVARGDLVPGWLSALELRPGQRVLDIGSGPGYTSLRAAEAVGPAGRVYAVDRSADALAYLARLQQEQGLPQVERIIGDAAVLAAFPEAVDAVLITMMLHHTDDARPLLANVARLVPPEAVVLIAEFHPDGPCDDGPPHAHRIHPDVVRQWCTELGLTVVQYQRQTPEHYMLLVRRG